MSLMHRLKNLLFPQRETDPEKAYDLWAAGYDDQPGNLVLDMDEALFSSFIKTVSLEGKTIADIGCGTGRHWQQLWQQRPARMIGYDISAGMLQKLKAKFSRAEVYQLKNYRLVELPDHCCDLIVSTLALAHMPESGKVLQEWARVLKPGGEMIITDYHPSALKEGGKRTFRHEGKLIAVKNYIHPLEQVRAELRQLGLEEIRFSERVIDESVKAYYIQQRALPLFEKFKGVPMIYGLQIKKADDPSRTDNPGQAGVVSDTAR